MKSISKQPVNNSELKEILREYFSSSNELEKPLVILSKPHSGRTSTIKQISEEMNIERKSIHHMHIYQNRCPLLHSTKLTALNGETMSFDEWMEAFLEEHAKKYLDKSHKEYQYCIVELDPNEFVSIKNNALWGDAISGRIELGEGYLKALKSDKFQLVAYYPDVEEWIEWAKDNKYEDNKYDPRTIEFASENPELYELISYEIFDWFEWRLREMSVNFGDHIRRGPFDVREIIFTEYFPTPEEKQIVSKACINFLSKRGIPYSE